MNPAGRRGGFGLGAFGHALTRSIRTRLLVLIFTLVGAVPVAAFAVLTVRNNVRLMRAASVQSTLMVEQATVAQHHAAIADIDRMLQAIGTTPGLLADPNACGQLLATAIRLRSGRYAALAVTDRGGGIVCAAPADAVVPPVPAAPGADFRVDPVSTTKTGKAIEFTAERTLRDDAGNAAGSVRARIRMDWLTAPALGGATEPIYALWLVRPDDATIAIPGHQPIALPPAGALAELLHAPPETVIRSERSGRLYAYTFAELGEGLRLMVAHDVTAVARTARQKMFARITELGLLLAVGLAVVGFGANAVIAWPLKRLARAVRGWRAGGDFDTANLGAVPAEIEEVRVAFAQAITRLGERERELSAALAQQDLLMREIHHRVKNNLQIVASLLNLQSARIRQPEARAEFRSARDRVHALATLHRHLYSYGELHTINMRSFLTELGEQLFEAFGETPGARIALEIEAPELRMSSDQAVPLALIVTELVSNALKHAFPAGRSGRIAVRLEGTEGAACLSVSDDGIGMAQPSARDGVGLQLVEGFARQLHATLTVNPESGTRYDVQLALHEGHVPEQDAASEEMAGGTV